MTEEKIEIKSREYAESRGHEHYNFLFEENAGSPVDFARLCYADGLKDGATEVTKDLEAQIEKMKNCFNCAKGDWNNRVKCIKSGCVNKDKWEIKEK